MSELEKLATQIASEHGYLIVQDWGAVTTKTAHIQGVEAGIRAGLLRAAEVADARQNYTLGDLYRRMAAGQK